MKCNMNLSKILKGHEGETFYSPIFGKVKLHEINFDNVPAYPIVVEIDECTLEYFTSDGRFFDSPTSQCFLFPSEDSQDWDAWYAEHKPVRTWDDFEKKAKKEGSELLFSILSTKIEKDGTIIFYNDAQNKANTALLKISALIAEEYGGNPTYRDFTYDSKHKPYIIVPVAENFQVVEAYDEDLFSRIAFHTKEQAEEFLKYPENKKLLRKYFMMD